MDAEPTDGHIGADLRVMCLQVDVVGGGHENCNRGPTNVGEVGVRSGKVCDFARPEGQRRRILAVMENETSKRLVEVTQVFGLDKTVLWNRYQLLKFA